MTFPLMADANPYIKGGVTAGVLDDRLSSCKGNSANHGINRPGENVLFVDSHVFYEASPDVGLQGLADPALAASNASRFRDDCYTVFAAGGSVFADPGSAAPTATNCNLGGKSDACLVP
jgi:hypothetical protein